MAANFARFFARSTGGSGIEQKTRERDTASPRSDRSDKSDEYAPAARHRARPKAQAQTSTTDTTAVTMMGVDTTRIPSPGEAREEEDSLHITFRKEDMEQPVPMSAAKQLTNEDLKRLRKELGRAEEATEEDKEGNHPPTLLVEGLMEYRSVKLMAPLRDTEVLIHDDTQDVQTAEKRYKEMSEQYEQKGLLDMSSLGAGGTVKDGTSPSPSAARSDGEQEVGAARYPPKARSATPRDGRRDEKERATSPEQSMMLTSLLEDVRRMREDSAEAIRASAEAAEAMRALSAKAAEAIHAVSAENNALRAQCSAMLEEYSARRTEASDTSFDLSPLAHAELEHARDNRNATPLTQEAPKTASPSKMANKLRKATSEAKSSKKTDAKQRNETPVDDHEKTAPDHAQPSDDDGSDSSSSSGSSGGGSGGGERDDSDLDDSESDEDLLPPPPPPKKEKKKSTKAWDVAMKATTLSECVKAMPIITEESARADVKTMRTALRIGLRLAETHTLTQKEQESINKTVASYNDKWKELTDSNTESSVNFASNMKHIHCFRVNRAFSEMPPLMRMALAAGGSMMELQGLMEVYEMFRNNTATFQVSLESKSLDEMQSAAARASMLSATQNMMREYGEEPTVIREYRRTYYFYCTKANKDADNHDPGRVPIKSMTAEIKGTKEMSSPELAHLMTHATSHVQISAQCSETAALRRVLQHAMEAVCTKKEFRHLGHLLTKLEGETKPKALFSIQRVFLQGVRLAPRITDTAEKTDKPKTSTPRAAMMKKEGERSGKNRGERTIACWGCKGDHPSFRCTNVLEWPEDVRARFDKQQTERKEKGEPYSVWNEHRGAFKTMFADREARPQRDRRESSDSSMTHVATLGARLGRGGGGDRGGKARMMEFTFDGDTIQLDSTLAQDHHAAAPIGMGGMGGGTPDRVEPSPMRGRQARRAAQRAHYDECLTRYSLGKGTTKGAALETMTKALLIAQRDAAEATNATTKARLQEQVLLCEDDISKTTKLVKGIEKRKARAAAGAVNVAAAERLQRAEGDVQRLTQVGKCIAKANKDLKGTKLRLPTFETRYAKKLGVPPHVVEALDGKAEEEVWRYLRAEQERQVKAEEKGEAATGECGNYLLATAMRECEATKTRKRETAHETVVGISNEDDKHEIVRTATGFEFVRKMGRGTKAAHVELRARGDKAVFAELAPSPAGGKDETEGAQDDERAAATRLCAEKGEGEQEEKGEERDEKGGA